MAKKITEHMFSFFFVHEAKFIFKNKYGDIS